MIIFFAGGGFRFAASSALPVVMLWRQVNESISCIGIQEWEPPCNIRFLYLKTEISLPPTLLGNPITFGLTMELTSSWLWKSFKIMLITVANDHSFFNPAAPPSRTWRATAWRIVGMRRVTRLTVSMMSTGACIVILLSTTCWTRVWPLWDPRCLTMVRSAWM